MQQLKNLLLTLLVLGASCSQKRMIETKDVYQTESYGFSQAIVSNGFLFTSGQVGWDKEYQLAGSTFQDQVRQSFLNLEEIVKESGGSFDDVIHLRFYVVDLDEEKRKMITHCMQKCFTSHYKPASTLLGVQNLARENLLVEIEMVAQLNHSKIRN